MARRTNGVGSTNGLTVKRHVKGKRKRVELDAPKAQHDYVEKYNAVDKNDRDSADYSTTIRTIRYYLRIVCWALDRVVHTCYVVVCYLFWVNPIWAKYLNKNSGRHDFQIHLAIQLMIIGITWAWDGEGERPDWMRQGDWVPCDCNKCFFCLNGHTTGIAHKQKRQKVDIEYKCGSVLNTDKCNVDRIGLKKGSSFCRMCYRNQPLELDSKTKKKNCKSSTMGCLQCQEHICKGCWDKGYDKHL